MRELEGKQEIKLLPFSSQLVALRFGIPLRSCFLSFYGS
jgi:hypothetical protein